MCARTACEKCTSHCSHRRALYAASERDQALYALLDTYAAYCPALLLPVERPASRTRRGGEAGGQSTIRLANWARTLPRLVLPDIVPGLCIHVGDSAQSCVPRFLHLAMVAGVGCKDTSLDDRDEAIGSRIAASLGRLLAVNHVYRRRQQKRQPNSPQKSKKLAPGDIPLFDPVASVMLDQVYVRCAHLGHVPTALLSFLGHVVHSIGADAVAHLRQDGELSWRAWEEAWRPTLVALARILALLPPVPWDDVFAPLLRPLSHLAAMDGLSDEFSATIVQALVRLLMRWTRLAPENAVAQNAAGRLFPWLLELEEALLMDGNPTLPIYHAALELHTAAIPLGGKEATNALYPFPFFLLASPPAFAGSVATLAKLFGLVAALRHGVQHASLPAAPVNEMILALVDLVWSGRAYGTLQQHGLKLDGHLAIDPQTIHAFKEACDARRIVPFVLVGSLSHSALLAPLFEVYCNEVLLPSATHPFIRAPITPSALRPAREHGLPPQLQYTDIRVGFLRWLADRGAPQLLALVETTVPSLSKAS